jgi:hypothetical protein
MGARSSPGAEETIHGPVAYPGTGSRGCEAVPVSTRSRTVSVLLSTLVVGSIVLAGCGSDDADPGSSGSSAAPETSETATTEPVSEGETAEDGSSDVPAFPGNAEPDTAEPSSDARVTVSDIRLGRHDGFDRVVFEVGGTGTPGWDVRYVDEATSQGSGDPVAVAGDAVLQVTLTGMGYPYDTGVEEYAGGPLTAGETQVVTEIVFDATYEGTTAAFVGTAGRTPFRVYALEGPARVVVEVADVG